MEPLQVQFRFHGSLNDFLPLAQRGRLLPYPFREQQSVKDAIESLGVPHVAVAALLAGDAPVGFDYLLRPGDRIDVFETADVPALPASYDLKQTPLPFGRFVVDVHAGKLARRLRMLGFDTAYRPDWDKKTIIHLATGDQRIVLTRDVALLKLKELEHGYWLRTTDEREQLMEVVRYYALTASFRPFTRCIACNGVLQPVPKEAVAAHLQPGTLRDFNEFWECPDCARVFWKGSHYERMLRRVAALSHLR